MQSPLHQQFRQAAHPSMSIIQENLKQANAAYVQSFDKGHLALPPAKKYLVRESRAVNPCRPVSLR